MRPSREKQAAPVAPAQRVAAALDRINGLINARRVRAADANRAVRHGGPEACERQEELARQLNRVADELEGILL